MCVKFFRCSTCGNIIELINNSGVPVVCCGKPMEEMNPNTSDGAFEKHVPEVIQEGNEVSVIVGSVEHPMTDEHYIQWICIETKHGVQRKHLTPLDKPMAKFILVPGDELLGVYEYCNLHGLWKK